MTRTTVSRTIEAPAHVVFDTVSDIRNFAEAVPQIVRTEFLSDVVSGVGTRFRETRSMRGKEQTVELEVTELVENDRVRIVSDTHGTVWDTSFAVTSASPEGPTELVMTMDAKPYRLVPRLMVPLMKGFVKKAIEGDMDAVKAYCEEANGAAAS